MMPWANCAALDHDELITDGSSDNESNLLTRRINSRNTISAHRCIMALQFLHVFEHDASRCDIDHGGVAVRNENTRGGDASVKRRWKRRGKVEATKETCTPAEYEEQWSQRWKLTFLYVEPFMRRAMRSVCMKAHCSATANDAARP